MARFFTGQAHDIIQGQVTGGPSKHHIHLCFTKVAYAVSAFVLSPKRFAQVIPSLSLKMFHQPCFLLLPCEETIIPL